MAVLYMGTESGRQRLRAGFGQCFGDVRLDILDSAVDPIVEEVRLDFLPKPFNWIELR